MSRAIRIGLFIGLVIGMSVWKARLKAFSEETVAESASIP